jgi:hypothetical protein
LSGCNWQSSTEVSLAGVLVGPTATVPVPIPSALSLDAVVLWSQAVVIGVSLQSTNGFSSGLGQ